MKFFVAFFLIVVAVFIGIQSYRLFSQRSNYLEKTNQLQLQANVLSSENSEVGKDIQFYQNPDNATKELQSKLNYKKPDEQMIILVPPERDGE